MTCAAPSKTSGSAYFWLHSIKKRQHTHAQTFWVYVFLHCTKRADFPTMSLAVCCSVLMTLQHVCSSMFPCVSNQPLATSNLTLFYLHIFIYDSNGPNLRLDEAAAIWAFTQLCSGTMCCQSGSQLRAHSFSNARLRPEAAPSACELSCLWMNGWYVHGAADKQYEMCFPTLREREKPLKCSHGF